MLAYNPVMRQTVVTCWVVAVFTAAASATGPADAVSWFDRPLANWNEPGAPVPTPSTSRESHEAIAKRCGLTPRRSTAAERALADAGWIPFLHVDRQLIRGDIEIVGGLAAADELCQPADFNLFVFVGGHFAGTLSPIRMRPLMDGSPGAVRIVGLDAITAEFSRFRDGDPSCRAWAHVAMRFQIDRSTPRARVVPVERRIRE
jgi:hypothetical protein